MKNKEAEDYNIEIFQERINLMNLEGLRWKLASNDSLKITKDLMCGRVNMNNEVQRDILGVDVIFVINEEVFDRLLEPSQLIIVDKLLAQVNYNLETEKVKKNTPDVQEFSGILQKYSFDKLQAISIEVSQIYEKLEEENTKNDGDNVND